MNIPIYKFRDPNIRRAESANEFESTLWLQKMSDFILPFENVTLREKVNNFTSSKSSSYQMENQIIAEIISKLTYSLRFPTNNSANKMGELIKTLISQEEFKFISSNLYPFPNFNSKNKIGKTSEEDIIDNLMRSNTLTNGRLIDHRSSDNLIVAEYLLPLNLKNKIDLLNTKSKAQGISNSNTPATDYFTNIPKFKIGSSSISSCSETIIYFSNSSSMLNLFESIENRVKLK